MPINDISTLLSRKNPGQMWFGVSCAILAHGALLSLFITRDYHTPAIASQEKGAASHITVRFSAAPAEQRVETPPPSPEKSLPEPETTEPVPDMPMPEKPAPATQPTPVVTAKIPVPDSRPTPRMLKKPTPPVRKTVKKTAQRKKAPAKKTISPPAPPRVSKKTPPAPAITPTPAATTPISSTAPRPKAAPVANPVSTATPVIRKARLSGGDITPLYPKRAKRLRQEGTVWLRLMISATGRITEVIIDRSSGYTLLDKEAVRAVKRRRFIPRTVNGNPVASVATVPIEFQLR